MKIKNLGALVVVEYETVWYIYRKRPCTKSNLERPLFKGNLYQRCYDWSSCFCNFSKHIDDCLQIMTDKHIRHLPVLENGKIVGVISIGNFVKSIIEEKNYIIENLQQYIAS